jgi:hypothetical protein
MLVPHQHGLAHALAALQVGYGADAVCPYLAYDALFALQRDGKLPASLSQDQVVDALIKSVSVGILKVGAWGREKLRSDRAVIAGDQSRQY